MPLRSDDDTPSSKPRRARNWAFGCFGTLAVLALLVWGYIAWANMLPPASPPPTVTLPNPNGYDAVMAVFPRVQRAPGNAEVSDNKVSMDALRKAVRQQKPYLDELRAALKLPYRNPPLTDPDASYTQGMAPARQVARALAAEGRVLLADGRPAEAWGSWLDAIEMGCKLPTGGVIIHELVGSALCTISIASADGNATGLSTAQARELGRRLDRIMQNRPAHADALREEKRFSLLWFRKQATEPPLLEDEFEGELGWTDKARRIGLRYLYPKTWAHSATRTFWDGAIREAEKPAWQRARLPAPTDPFLRENQVLDPFQFSEIDARLSAHLGLLRLQLALQEHRGRFGAYPSRLEQLSSSLKSLPPDPFTGKPFVYRRSGPGYVLYSVGQNRVDDGGSPGVSSQPQAGDLVAGRLFPRRR